MNVLTDSTWRVWDDAVRRDDIDRALRAFYADLDQAVADRRPVCNASGRCCKFEAYGHRLYVTGLEIAWFVNALGPAPPKTSTANSPCVVEASFALRQLEPATSRQPAATTPNCPYQIDGLCSTHAIRPLGCRAFFCEEGTEAWQQDTTERFLDRLKALHAGHDLPYAYMEWRAGLAEANQFIAGST
ncbi:MAG: hypothetical protein AAGI37_01975 [Planctomycetota bacterium]